MLTGFKSNRGCVGHAKESDKEEVQEGKAKNQVDVVKTAEESVGKIALGEARQDARGGSHTARD